MEIKYKGMTVNERLYVSGLIDKFYKAIEEKDAYTVVTILKEIDLGENDIKANLAFNNLI